MTSPGPRLSRFLPHRQGRRRRFRTRTRTYLDSEGCMPEQKLSGARGVTDKRRIRYDAAHRAGLTDEAMRFLEDGLPTAYRMNSPDVLVPTATTGCLRATFVPTPTPSRVIFDAGLACVRKRRSVAADPAGYRWSRRPATPTPRWTGCCRSLGVHPVSIGKYRLAVAVLYPRGPIPGARCCAAISAARTGEALGTACPPNACAERLCDAVFSDEAETAAGAGNPHPRWREHRNSGPGFVDSLPPLRDFPTRKPRWFLAIFHFRRLQGALQAMMRSCSGPGR